MKLRNGINNLYDKINDKFLFEDYEVFSYIESVRAFSSSFGFEYNALIKVKDIEDVIHFSTILNGKDIDNEVVRQLKIIVRNMATSGEASPIVRVGKCVKCGKPATVTSKDDLDELNCKWCSSSVEFIRGLKKKSDDNISYIEKTKEDVLIIAVSNDFKEEDLNSYIKDRITSISEVIVLNSNKRLKDLLREVEIVWLPNSKDNSQYLRYFKGKRVSGYIVVK
mgnify:CR=1 FL=1